MNSLKQVWPSYKITIRRYVILESLKKKPKILGIEPSSVGWGVVDVQSHHPGSSPLSRIWVSFLAVLLRHVVPPTRVLFFSLKKEAKEKRKDCSP